MEFVVATFSTSRVVRIDGAPRGRTGQVLRMQAGTHNFDLGAPPNYTPSSVMTPVRGTTLAAPMVIAFMPLAGAAAGAVLFESAAAPKGARRGHSRRVKGSSRKSAGSRSKTRKTKSSRGRRKRAGA